MALIDFDLITEDEAKEMLADILLFMKNNNGVRLSYGRSWLVIDDGDDGYWITVYVRQAYAKHTIVLYEGIDFGSAFEHMKIFNGDL